MSKRKVVVCVSAVIALVSATLLFSVSPSRGAVSKVSPGFIEVPDGGTLFLYAYNASGDRVDAKIVLEAAPNGWDKTEYTFLNMDRGDQNDEGFLCDTTDGSPCVGIPIVSPGSLIWSGYYNSATAGYVDTFDAGSFKKI